MRRISAIVTGAVVAIAGTIALTGPPVTADDPDGRSLTIGKEVVGSAPEDSEGFIVQLACAEVSFGGGRPAFSLELPYLPDGAPDPDGLDVLPAEWSIIDGAWVLTTPDLLPFDCTLTETGTSGADSVGFDCAYTPPGLYDEPPEFWDQVCSEIDGGRIQMPLTAPEGDGCDADPTLCYDAAVVTITNVFATDADVDRISGENRYATAVAMSQDYFPAGAETVYVATGEDFPDALALGVVAGLNDGPVLLVRSDGIPDEVLAEIQRLEPGTIVVAGGVAAVSEDVVDDLAEEADTVIRVFGTDRYGTAAALSLVQFPDGADTVFIATGEQFADALAGVPPAGRNDGPLLLVRPGSIPAATAAELERLDPTSIFILGGPNAISDDVAEELDEFADSVDRLFGDNRYETATALSSQFFEGGAGTVFIASGDNFPDALSAGPIAIVVDGPILLSRPACVPTEVLDEINRLDPDSIILVGGEMALAPAVAELEACPA